MCYRESLVALKSILRFCVDQWSPTYSGAGKLRLTFWNDARDCASISATKMELDGFGAGKILLSSDAGSPAHSLLGTTNPLIGKNVGSR
jgi:hypothetical protein